MSAAKARRRPGRLALLLIVAAFVVGSLLTALAASASTPGHGAARVAANAAHACPSVASHVSLSPSHASKWSYDRQAIDLPAADYAYDLGMHNASAQPSLAPGLASVATTRTERGPPTQTLDDVRLRLAAEGGVASLSASDLSGDVLSNYNRFLKSLPSGAGDTTITQLPDGSYQFSSDVPATNIPGSYATYTKVVGPDGVTTTFYKTTIAPDGSVVSVKVKYP